MPNDNNKFIYGLSARREFLAELYTEIESETSEKSVSEQRKEAARSVLKKSRFFHMADKLRDLKLGQKILAVNNVLTRLDLRVLKFRKVDGRLFVLLGPLGQGNYGAVDYAVEIVDGVLSDNKLVYKENRSVQQTANEAESLFRLGNLTAADETQIVMPLLEGERLDDMLNNGKWQSMGSDKLANIFRNIFDEIEKMHARGIIHCDLHMGNILVSDKIQLIDYGKSLAGDSYPISVIERIQKENEDLKKAVEEVIDAMQVIGYQLERFGCPVNMGSIIKELTKFTETRSFSDREQFKNKLSNCLGEFEKELSNILPFQQEVDEEEILPGLDRVSTVRHIIPQTLSSKFSALNTASMLGLSVFSKYVEAIYARFGVPGTYREFMDKSFFETAFSQALFREFSTLARKKITAMPLYFVSRLGSAITLLRRHASPHDIRDLAISIVNEVYSVVASNLNNYRDVHQSVKFMISIAFLQTPVRMPGQRVVQIGPEIKTTPRRERIYIKPQIEKYEAETSKGASVEKPICFSLKLDGVILMAADMGLNHAVDEFRAMLR